MKRLLTLLFILTLTVASFAADYCETPLQMGDKTIQLSCEQVSAGQYRITISSSEDMNGLGGSFCNVNGVGGYQLNAAGHFEVSADHRTITCDITSSSAPNVYTPLYVIFANGGERNCAWPSDVSWQACGSVPADPSADPSRYCSNIVPSYLGAGHNLALNKCSFAGNNAQQGPAGGNDGNINTRMGTEGGSHPADDWWYVDLDTIYSLSTVKILWEAAYSNHFLIQTALSDPSDEASWTTRLDVAGVQLVGNNAGAYNTYELEGYAQYVRIKSLSNATGWGMSMWECEVYGKDMVEAPSMAVPVINSAAVALRDLNNFTLNLSATQESEPVHTYHIVDVANNIDLFVFGQTNPIDLHIADKEDYTLTITAIGLDGQESAPVVLTSSIPYCSGLAPTYTGPTQNIALDKCAFAAQDSYNATRANDGNNGSYFKTNQAGANHPADEWWYVNLDSTYNLSEVRISWDVSYAKHFLIQVAVDEPTSESDWRTVKVVSGTPTYLNSGAGNNYDVYDVHDNYAHYVRIKADECNTLGCSDGIAFFEVQIYADRFATEADLAAPELVSAVLSSLNTTTATLTMVATQDNEDIHRYHVVDEHNGIDTIVYTNNSNQVNVVLPNNRHYNLTVTAVGFDGQESEPIVVDVEMPYDIVYNIALNKPSVSGYEAWENERFSAGRANDGLLNTRWGTNDNRTGDFACDVCTEINHPEGDWWMVDLGEEYRLTEIQIFWELAYSFDYLVEVSLDGSTWTTISHEVFTNQGTDMPIHTQHATPATGDSEATIFALADEPARYVRIANQGANTCYNDCVYGISIWEVRVFGSNYHVPTQCVWNGGPGSGSKGNGAAKPFANGYTLSVGMNETGDSILVDFLSYDDNIGLTGVCNGVFQEFVVEDVQQNTNEYRYLNQDTHNLFHFFGAVPYTHQHNKWNNNIPMEDWEDGQTVRIAVKYEYSGGFSITEPVYYELGVGCAPDTFVIYHHDDKQKENDRVEFEGGKILQPIVYRRILTPGVFENLYLPFEVEKVTVSDTDGEYPLIVQTPGHEGNYWLRTFDAQGVGVPVNEWDFKGNWQSATTKLPQKGVCYNIKVPAYGEASLKDEYYYGKYINFYGKGYQTIESTFTLGDKPDQNNQGESMYLFYGNQTMMNQLIGDAYMLSADGLWYENHEWTGNTKNVLYPFECYVLSDDYTMQTFSRIGVRNPAPGSATSLPEIVGTSLFSFYDGSALHLQADADMKLDIYTIDGRLVCTCQLQGNAEQTVPLVRGIYLLKSNDIVKKVAF